MDKRCSTCKEVKDVSEFSKSNQKRDGFTNQCRSCRSKRRRELHKENPLKNRQYIKQWARANPDKIKKEKHEYYITHKDHILMASKKYAKDNQERHVKTGKAWAKNNPNKVRAMTILQRILHPDRYKARTAVGNAIRAGKLSKVATLVCAHCGVQASQYHHHLGYEKEHQLDVIPLCRPCHVQADKS